MTETFTRCCFLILLGDDCSVSATDATWLTVHAFNPPAGRASTAAALVDDSLYVFGGETLRNRFTIHHNTSEHLQFHR